MTARSGGLKRGDAVLVPLLAAGTGYRYAGMKAGVSERTVSRRMQDQDFRRWVREEKDRLVAATRDQLTALSLEAVFVLRLLMEEGRDDNIKLGASRAIIGLAHKMRTEALASESSQQMEVLLRHVEVIVDEVLIRREPTLEGAPTLRLADGGHAPELRTGVQRTGAAPEIHPRRRGGVGRLVRDAEAQRQEATNARIMKERVDIDPQVENPSSAEGA